MSVVTAVRHADLALLGRAHASLVRQDVPWTWLVEVDGGSGLDDLPDAVARDDRVEVAASGVSMGVSAARNLALARVRTEGVAVLDADDELTPRALRVFGGALSSDARPAVVTGAFVCVDEGVPKDVLAPQVEAGDYGPGALPRLALEMAALPVKTQVVAYRAQVLRAVGGWPGLPLCQDVAAFMAVALRAPVHVSHEVLYRYHRWQGQATDPAALARHDLMLRSRTFLAQQLAAALELEGSPGRASAGTPAHPTF